MLLYLLLRSVFVRHIGINCEVCSRCDSATFVAAITRSLYTSSYRFLLNPLAVLGQAQKAHGIDEGGGEVELTAKFTGGIVEGECVMVVMEAFS